MRRTISPATAAIAVVLASAAGAQLPCTAGTQLQASTAGKGYRHGAAVALEGDLLLAGTPSDGPSAAAEAGSVTVYRRVGTGWIEETRIQPADAAGHGQGTGVPDFGDRFGTSVELDGATAFIGSPGQDQAGQEAGAVYVYADAGTAWTLQTKLVASDPAQGDELGTAVAVDGIWAVAGAPRKDDLGTDSGAAYVFRFDGASWSQDQKLVASDGGGSGGFDLGDQFGAAVAIDADLLVVGAPGGPAPALGGFDDSGVAYVFRREASGWVEEAKLEPSDPDFDALFGSSVALEGDTIVVGCPNRLVATSPFSAQEGAAYVYRRSGTTWTQQARLTAIDPSQLARFGQSVSLAGGVALVGAPGFSSQITLGPSMAGAVYAFRDGPFGFVLESRITTAQQADDHHVGIAVATDGTRSAAGADGTTQSGPATGSVYVHELADPGCPPDLVPAQPGVSLGAGGPFGFFLNGGVARAGQVYLLIATTSGTAPGFTLDGQPIPLNTDVFSVLALTGAGAPPFLGYVGLLSGVGTASATLLVPPGTNPAFAGTTVHHVLLSFDVTPIPSLDFVSEAEAVLLLP